METFPAAELGRLAREGWLIVDVRAPVEFREGSIPASLNLPILSDDERARVGTVYKQQGGEAAVRLGHELVSGAVRAERIRAWVAALAASERSLLTCFRGGQRSRIAQQWSREAGVDRPRLREGYKGARRELRRAIERSGDLLVVGGPTGAGKTDVLRGVRGKRAILDLEALAEHRGSAFGGDTALQPSQTTFENRVGWELLKTTEARVRLVEDESRLIGRVALPETFYEKLRASPVVLIDEPLAARAARIFRDYVELPLHAGADPFPMFRSALGKIRNRLGGARAQELLADMERAGTGPENLVWIGKLLEWYYDPQYENSLRRRDPKIAFRGSAREVSAYLERAQE